MNASDRYRCEYCGTVMTEPYQTERVAGHSGPIILAFCEECSEL